MAHENTRTSSKSEIFELHQSFKRNIGLRLDPSILIYYENGAYSQQTLEDNVDAFKRWQIVPKCHGMKAIETKIDTTLSIFGKVVSSPIGVSPTMAHQLLHQQGEIGTTKAAQKHNSVMILSHFSSTPVEHVIEEIRSRTEVKTSPIWQQCYFYPDFEQYSVAFVDKIVKLCDALVLTIDSPAAAISKENFSTDLVHKKSPNANFSGQYKSIADEQFKKRKNYKSTPVTWKHVRQLKASLPIPLILKGIMTGEDAELAIQNGTDAIFVSNHGGRMLDSVVATLDALPEIATKVKGRCPLFLDGGIRNGYDVFKALALGADAVFIGRAALWGLAFDGQNGVEQVLRILNNELRDAMWKTGCNKLSEINMSCLSYVGSNLATCKL